MKLKKRKKHGRMRGHRTHGHSTKLNKGKGSHGGVGMSGTGKRADQKKSLIIQKYDVYFGRRGFTSRKTQRKKEKIFNLKEIEQKFKPGEIDLSDYKILGEGEVTGKFIIKAKEASNSALEKVKKAGGEIQILKRGEVKEEKQKKADG